MARCPICRTPIATAYIAPCSKPCAVANLRWTKPGGYTIAARERIREEARKIIEITESK